MNRVALCAVLALPMLVAAPAPAATPSPRCTVPDHLPPARLSGLWQLVLWSDAGSAERPAARGAMLFEGHPDYPGSVRGELRRGTAGNDRTAQVSGDVTDGEFHLDESADGRTMSAVWSGTAQDCDGRLTITGTRRAALGQPDPEPPLHFRLEKTPGWR